MRDIDFLSDKRWRVNHLYSIVNKDSQRVKFKPNVIQQAVLSTRKNRKDVLKARQFGVSTAVILDYFDDTIWNENITTCILAHDKKSIEKLFRIVARAYDFLDPEYRPALARGGGSKHELFFPGINSRIYCDLQSRGDTIHRLHISEVAFIADPNRIKATTECVPIDCPITKESTPNGMNHYYDSRQEKNDEYEKLFFPWYIFPDYRLSAPATNYSDDEKKFIRKAKKLYGVEITPYQIAFRRAKQLSLKDLFIQEYPEDEQTCFLSSGNSAVDLMKVKTLMDKHAMHPIREEGAIKIFHPRDKSKSYAIGADTSEGHGGDYSFAQVFEIQTRRQMATIRGNRLKPHEFADLINEVSKEYLGRHNVPPILAVERNNHGHAVNLELSEHIKYPNLYIGPDEKIGWLTDRVTRPVMLDVFIQGVENESVRLCDAVTYGELLTLVNNDGKIEASDGKNDDGVMAGAIALQMCIKEGASSIYNDIASRIKI